MLKRLRPRKLEFNEALLSRICANHPKIPVIEADSRKREAGYYGEVILDSYLNYLPEKDYFIFQGIRLANDRGTHFQIDCLILHSTHIPFIESKNLSGSVEIDEHRDQLIQNEDIVFENPMLQAQFQYGELRNWLRRHKFPCRNLEYLVGMMNKNCLLKVEPGSEAAFRVCRGRRVIYRLTGFREKYREVVYPPDVLRKLCKLLIKSHVEPSYDLQKCYGISRPEILPGVHCPPCGRLGMKYRGGSWHCDGCGCKSKDAHLKALKDYYLLFGPEITNQQFREFLQIDSSDIANKMLRKLKLAYSGVNRHRVYLLSLEKLR
ncbi:nuclease-related domain-containing protein [Neobacillus sp. LXY-4]|uniref:nuclease-related domain-containing protein n=1 Tax=Neobacillus sp. LXY-4 TaxID=3379826 RepID=UPI003EE41731